MGDLLEMLFREKPVKILLKLNSANGKSYASIIAKEADCTYSHTVKVIQRFEEEGLLKFVKDGRIKAIELTPKGRKVAEELKKLLTLLK